MTVDNYDDNYDSMMYRARELYKSGSTTKQIIDTISKEFNVSYKDQGVVRPDKFDHPTMMWVTFTFNDPLTINADDIFEYLSYDVDYKQERKLIH